MQDSPRSLAKIQPQVLETVHAFVQAGKTGHITLQVKEGRIMQVETHEIKRV